MLGVVTAEKTTQLALYFIYNSNKMFENYKNTLSVLAPPAASNKFQRDDETFATWSLVGDMVEFKLSATVASGSWVALGISDNRQMENTDVLHVGINANGAVATDR